MGSKFKGLEKLIVVPTHAVYVGREPRRIQSDKYWITEFQGEGQFYAEHADAGLNEAAEDKGVLLIFSGGQTREQAGPLSEAQSYWFLEQQKKWLGYEDVVERATTEEFARDSYENLKFSIHRFRQCVGKYPKNIIVCGWRFKEDRYKFHASTVGWDLDNFVYVSVNNPVGDPDDINTPFGKSVIGERRTLELFRQVPSGDSGELLEKRLKRDPFKRGNPYNFLLKR